MVLVKIADVKIASNIQITVRNLPQTVFEVTSPYSTVVSVTTHIQYASCKTRNGFYEFWIVMILIDDNLVLVLGIGH